MSNLENIENLEINLFIRERVGLQVPDPPNNHHEWFFDMDDYFDYESILLTCSSCGLGIIWVSHKLLWVPSIRTFAKAGMSKVEDFELILSNSCEQILSRKRMMEALQ